jgi:parvulin-like peptidyl-prolyl isomerase
MTAPSLSGVAATAVIALCPDRPLLTADEANQLIRRHGLSRELARALVEDRVAATVPLTVQEEMALTASRAQAEGLTSEAALEQWLTDRHWSRDDLQAIATRAERLQRWSRWRFADEVEISFLDRKLDLDRVVYSLLRVQEQELAEELHQRLRGGEMSFAEAVELFSQGPERDTHGLIGPVALSAAHPELSARLRVGREGQLWSPFAIGDVWLVLRLERQRPARLDDSTRTQLLQDLFASWVAAQVEELLEGLPLQPVPRPEEAPQP